MEDKQAELDKAAKEEEERKAEEERKEEVERKAAEEAEKAKPQSEQMITESVPNPEQSQPVQGPSIPAQQPSNIANNTDLQSMQQPQQMQQMQPQQQQLMQQQQFNWVRPPGFSEQEWQTYVAVQTRMANQMAFQQPQLNPAFQQAYVSPNAFNPGWAWQPPMQQQQQMQQPQQMQQMQQIQQIQPQQQVNQEQSQLRGHNSNMGAFKKVETNQSATDKESLHRKKTLSESMQTFLTQADKPKSAADANQYRLNTRVIKKKEDNLHLSELWINLMLHDCINIESVSESRKIDDLFEQEDWKFKADKITSPNENGNAIRYIRSRIQQLCDELKNQYSNYTFEAYIQTCCFGDVTTFEQCFLEPNAWISPDSEKYETPAEFKKAQLDFMASYRANQRKSSEVMKQIQKVAQFGDLPIYIRVTADYLGVSKAAFLFTANTHRAHSTFKNSGVAFWIVSHASQNMITMQRLRDGKIVTRSQLKFRSLAKFCELLTLKEEKKKQKKASVKGQSIPKSKEDEAEPDVLMSETVTIFGAKESVEMKIGRLDAEGIEMEKTRLQRNDIAGGRSYIRTNKCTQKTKFSNHMQEVTWNLTDPGKDKDGHSDHTMPRTVKKGKNLNEDIEVGFLQDLCQPNEKHLGQRSFMNYFFKKDTMKIYAAIAKHQESLGKLEESYYAYTFIRSKRTRLQSLIEYNKANTCQYNGKQLIERLKADTSRNGSNLLLLLVKCVFAWLVGDEAKRKSVWFYGEPNTGKTTLAKYFDVLFDTADLAIKGQWTHDHDYELLRTSHEPNLVVMNEISSETTFAGSAFEDMKTLMEGLGIMTNKKYQIVRKKYVGCGVYICSNTLPMFSKSLSISQRKMSWRALQQRTYFHWCGQTQSSFKVFPLTCEETGQLLEHYATMLIENHSDMAIWKDVVQSDVYEYGQIRAPRTTGIDEFGKGHIMDDQFHHKDGNEPIVVQQVRRGRSEPSRIQDHPEDSPSIHESDVFSPPMGHKAIEAPPDSKSKDVVVNYSEGDKEFQFIRKDKATSPEKTGSFGAHSPDSKQSKELLRSQTQQIFPNQIKSKYDDLFLQQQEQQAQKQREFQQQVQQLRESQLPTFGTLASPAPGTTPGQNQNNLIHQRPNREFDPSGSYNYFNSPMKLQRLSQSTPRPSGLDMSRPSTPRLSQCAGGSPRVEEVPPMSYRSLDQISAFEMPEEDSNNSHPMVIGDGQSAVGDDVNPDEEVKDDDSRKKDARKKQSKSKPTYGHCVPNLFFGKSFQDDDGSHSGSSEKSGGAV